MSDVKLHIDEIIELVTCALNKTRQIRPWNRLRLRVCEHLIGKGLMEPAKPSDLLSAGKYPLIIPTLRQGAMVRLTDAGRDALCALPVDDYGFWFPRRDDIENAQTNCGCPPDPDTDRQAVTLKLDSKVTDAHHRRS